MTYRLGSLFSGIGGAELGFEWTGQFHTVFQVEREPFCQKVLAKHWPLVPRFDDVCNVGSHNLPACDVLVGGFPCQDLSFAGKGAGLKGARSGLWREFSRIIGELRPRVVCVENVPALTVRGLDRVLADFAAHGYDTEWQIISAAALNAPHLRERLFIVAYPSNVGRLKGRENDREHDGSKFGSGGQHADLLAYPSRIPSYGKNANPSDSSTNSAQSRRSGSSDTLPNPNRERRENAQPFTARAGQPGGSSDAGELPNWAGGKAEQPSPLAAAQPRVRGMADGVSSRMERLKALGNAIVPQVAQFVAQRILNSGVLKGVSV